MHDDDTRTARTFGRSLYSLLVPFPVACFVGTLLTDLAYVATDAVTWETFSVWLLTVGLVVAGLAVMAGVVDLVRSRRVRGLRQPWLRLLGHFVAFGLALVNVFVHSRDGYTAVVPEGVLLSTVTVLVLIATAVVGHPSYSYRTRGLA